MFNVIVIKNLFVDQAVLKYVILNFNFVSWVVRMPASASLDMYTQVQRE
jgi:hypothetical protein